jgi:hypothetical protein
LNEPFISNFKYIIIFCEIQREEKSEVHPIEAGIS